MFLSVFVHALVASIVWPNLFTLAVLFILLPLAFVLGTVSVVVDTITVGLVVLPLAVVNIAVSVDEATSTVSLVVFPVAFIERAVNPNLDALTILLAIVIPLALVLSAIVESLFLFSDTLDLVIVSGCGIVIESLEVFANLHH